MTNEPNDPDLKNVDAGSDADASPAPPMDKTPPDPNERSKPAPLETDDGEQQDDNVDDKGNKSGGGTVDQPT